MSRVESTIQECEECVAPVDAFSLIAEETRLDILEALWRADDPPVRFSELRAAVGTDDSARFNYHLSKLTDGFVRKTEAGYELRTAGRKVVQAVLSGSFNQHPERDVAIDDSCVDCGEPLRATYEDGLLRIVCPACGHGHGEYPFPPGGLHDRSDEEILHAFDQRVRHLHCLAKDGVCPECNGRMTTTVETGGECCLGADLHAEHVCQQCRHELCSAVGLTLLDAGPVVAFHADHGVDVSTTPYWRFGWCVADGRVERHEDRVVVPITLDDETLTVTLDGSLSVVDAERAPASD